MNGPNPSPSPHSIHRSWLRCSRDAVRVNAVSKARLLATTAEARNPTVSRSPQLAAKTGSWNRYAPPNPIIHTSVAITPSAAA